MKLSCTLAFLLLAGAVPVVGQDSTAAPPVLPEPARPAPSVPLIRPPVSPMGAFWRSLLIPGWGQAVLGRRTTGAIFLAAEGVALGMTLSTSSQLTTMRDTGSPNVADKEQQREDWLVLLGVNHLLAAMEAYVSAHLWDFPGDLTVQKTTNGVAGAVSLPVRLP